MAWALACSGGGRLGEVHLGVYQALRDWKLVPDALAGASAGGLVAGVLAAGADPAAVIAYGAAVAGRPHEYFRPRAARLMEELIPRDPAPPADSLLDADPFLDGLVALCPRPRRIEAWRVPAAVIAADLGSMDAVAFASAGGRAVVPPAAGWRVVTSGDLRTALRATMAIPGLFPPVRGPGEYLVDGGIADYLPADWAAPLGADRVVAVDIGGLGTGVPERAGILWALWRTEAYFTQTLSALRPVGVPVLRLEPPTPATGGLSAADFEALVELGHAAATARRGEIEAFLAAG